MISAMAAPVEALRSIPLFAGFGPKELERLAGEFRERTFSEGAAVTREGSTGAGFFVIKDGQAKVEVGGEQVRTLGPGDHFGEIALITEGPRTASVTAESELRCYGLTPWEFRPLVQTNAGIAWKILQALAKQVDQRH